MTGEPDDVDAMVEPVVPSRHRWLAGLLAAGPGDRVVDLGCGTGASLVQAAPTVPGGLLAGVDLSAAALARTAKVVDEVAAGLAPPPEVLCLQAQLCKNRKARGSSRLAALVKRGRLLVEVAH